VNTIRIMTYNIQRCRGGDGLTSLDRVLQVIEEGAPDVAALQEVDGPLLTEMAKRLGMRSFGEPTGSGVAFLSYFPLKGVQLFDLAAGGRCLRGDIDLSGKRMHLLNLQFASVVRQRQIDQLLGPNILGNPSLTCPTLVLGDFADRWSGAADMRLTLQLRRARGLFWTGTYPARFPLLARDRAYTRGGLRIVDARILRSGTARKASGHLPLILTLQPIDTRSYLKVEKLNSNRMEIAPG